MIIACSNEFGQSQVLKYRFRYFAKWNAYDIYVQRDEEGYY